MTILPATAILAAFGAASHFLPLWMRPELYFGVRVDPAFRDTEAGRLILLRYRLILWTSIAAALALAWKIRPEWAILLPVAGFLYAIVNAHRRTLAHAAPPATVVEVDLSAPVEKFPGGMLAMFLPIVLLSVLALWADRHFDQLPPRIPTHWGLHGANRWVMRTHGGVAGYLGVCALISLFFSLFAWGIFQWSRRASVGGPASAAERRFRRRNAQLLLFAAWFVPAQAWLMLAQPTRAGWAPVAAVTAIAIYLVVLVRYHQGAGDQAPDSCWKLGMIYYNPADPSMFIPKRFGVGYTFNFGNRWTWLLFGGVLAPIVCLSVFLK